MYAQAGSHLNYFVPNIPLANNAAEVLKEIDIGASSADHGEILCVKPCIIKRCQFTLTGEAASGTSVAPLVVFKKRPKPLTATDESTVCTLTIPTGTAIGATVYKDVEVRMAVGDSIEIAHVIGTGTPTGMGHYSMICFDMEQNPGSNSEMIASA